jgi:hypothetical protein
MFIQLTQILPRGHEPTTILIQAAHIISVKAENNGSILALIGETHGMSVQESYTEVKQKLSNSGDSIHMRF